MAAESQLDLAAYLIPLLLLLFLLVLMCAMNTEMHPDDQKCVDRDSVLFTNR